MNERDFFDFFEYEPFQYTGEDRMKEFEDEVERKSQDMAKFFATQKPELVPHAEYVARLLLNSFHRGVEAEARGAGGCTWTKVIPDEEEPDNYTWETDCGEGDPYEEPRRFCPECGGKIWIKMPSKHGSTDEDE